MDINVSFLRTLIIDKVFLSRDKHVMIKSDVDGGELSWIFDFRRVMMRSDFLDAYAELFLNQHKGKYPFQVGGLEAASIPLITAIVMKSKEKGIPVTGFFIRKSRKKKGLLNQIEGEVKDVPIILVDDILNSGSSFLQQVTVLKGSQQQGLIGQSAKIQEIHSILRFKHKEYYKPFYENGIHVESLFTLDDFSAVLPVSTIEEKKEEMTVSTMEPLWCFKGKNPQMWQVKPKSTPLLVADSLYFGTDNGYMMCLDRLSGQEKWSYRVAKTRKDGILLSSPLATDSCIIFGSYDGNVYALNEDTGKCAWMFMEADWIGGDMAYSKRHHYVYVGLRFGIFKKEGKVVALDARTGVKIWEVAIPSYVEGGIAYSEKQDMIFFGTKDLKRYGVSGKQGVVIWEHEAQHMPTATPYVCDAHNLVIFGGLALLDEYENRGRIYVCKIKTGDIHALFEECTFGTYASVTVHGTTVVVSSPDKYVYAFSLHTGNLLWKKNLGARSLAAPVVVTQTESVNVYLGANNGRLYEFDIVTGVLVGSVFFSERILNGVVCDAKNNLIFVSTQANELYAMQSKKEKGVK